MARESRPLGFLPRGWKVEEPELDPDHVGGVGVLRRADKHSLRLARRNLHEFKEADIEGQGLHLTDRTSGETWEVVVTHVDLLDPASSGVQAFVVRDGWFVALRPLGWKDERDTSQVIGEAYVGRVAEPADAVPVPAGLEIR